MKTIFSTTIVAAFACILCSCNSDTAESTVIAANQPAIASQTFKTADGWGYSVYVNNKLFIKQTSIPAIEGNRSFAKEEDAAKVATLVVNKLKQHEKPTIQVAELKQCGVIAMKNE